MPSRDMLDNHRLFRGQRSSIALPPCGIWNWPVSAANKSRDFRLNKALSIEQEKAELLDGLRDELLQGGFQGLRGNILLDLIAHLNCDAHADFSNSALEPEKCRTGSSGRGEHR